MKSKERMSGECRKVKEKKTLENIKRDFLDYFSKFSALNGYLDVKSCNLKHNQDFFIISIKHGKENQLQKEWRTSSNSREKQEKFMVK